MRDDALRARTSRTNRERGLLLRCEWRGWRRQPAARRLPGMHRASVPWWRCRSGMGPLRR